jgi:hypothetical protein
VLKTLSLIAALSGIATIAAAKPDTDHHWVDNHGPKDCPVYVPELDPASLMTAFVVVGGGLVLLRGRKAQS